MRRRILLGVVLAWGWGCAASRSWAAESLEAGFAEPPESARPWTYWWWLDSNASREGITRDLEEMRRQGIAGALLFDAGEGKGSPVGPPFMSDAWRELFKHALREADRLGVALSVNTCSGWNAGGTWVTPEHAAKALVYASVTVEGPGPIARDLPRPATWEGDYYRDVAVIAYPESGRPAGAPGLKHWEMKAARAFLGGVPDLLEQEDADVSPGERDCESRRVMDLTERTDAAGRLAWDVPAGRWTVLRFGYALLGARTSCASPRAQGYETDFFSPQAFDLHWSATGAKMIADAGPLAGRTLKYIHDDSYEVAGPNRLQPTWTPAFRTEFRQRRGYDLLGYLPVLAGGIVDSREISNRFLWDYRRTIADLFADHHYRRMHDAARRSGLGTHPESGGPFWPCIDALELEGINDVPMGEFWKRVPEQPDGKIMWSHDYHICDTVRQAASAAHIYGKPVCQAEAWTSMGPNWEEDLFALKDIGDRAFCAGLTRNMLCFYVHQPRLDILPGYQWEAAGTHFDRNVTWWGQARAWLDYLSRCQYLLQQGLFVADFCYFYGEDAPNYVPARTHMRPALPAGYDCDTINADVLLNRMGARDGRLVLPDGMSYRYLVLPRRRSMSPRVIRKVAELVDSGATILGSPPGRAPGLADYPGCDEVIRKAAGHLWADLDGRSRTEHRVGRGRVIRSESLAEVARGDRLPPDFSFREAAAGADIDFIHRSAAGAEIYFVSNQRSRTERACCVFRVRGRQPEIWDAVSGEHRDAPEYVQEEDGTAVPMEFAPRQSLFVVFRRPATGRKAGPRNFPAVEVAGELTGPWTLHFDPARGGPASVVFESLVDWTQRPEPGIRYYSGKAVYEKTFDLPAAVRGGSGRLWLDLGSLRNVAEVRLNGRGLGTVWTAPWRVEMGAAATPAGNRLEIAVVNLWPNRLIGDAGLPAEQRLTTTNVKKFKPDSPLLDSGLLGPVRLLIEKP
jgi:hypothetical protein